MTLYILLHNNSNTKKIGCQAEKMKILLTFGGQNECFYRNLLLYTNKIEENISGSY